MRIYIGYDSREDLAYEVCKYSIRKKNKTVEVIPLKLATMRELGIYTRPVDKKASTEFTFSRFLVPALCDYEGWALFIDCDFIFREDVRNLFDKCDDRYAIMCVQHDYQPKDGKEKMDGKVQHIYPRKNWSSCVLWNCGHHANKQVTVDLVNNPETTGKFLHRFSWLDDSQIGRIHHEWNWLVGWYREPEDGKPKAIHYTEGGPWFKNYRNCEYGDVWKEYLNQMMNNKGE
mgnify:CR=1 FL=1